MNRYGRISTIGLPACDAGLLESTNTQVALERCRPALVGRGQFAANVQFPDRAPFPVHGQMLAFNGRSHGRPAVLLHIHGSSPAEVTVVLAFTSGIPPKASSAPCFRPRSPASLRTSAMSPTYRWSSAAGTGTAARATASSAPAAPPLRAFRERSSPSRGARFPLRVGSRSSPR